MCFVLMPCLEFGGYCACTIQHLYPSSPACVHGNISSCAEAGRETGTQASFASHHCSVQCAGSLTLVRRGRAQSQGYGIQAVHTQCACRHLGVQAVINSCTAGHLQKAYGAPNERRAAATKYSWVDARRPGKPVLLCFSAHKALLAMRSMETKKPLRACRQSSWVSCWLVWRQVQVVEGRRML